MDEQGDLKRRTMILLAEGGQTDVLCAFSAEALAFANMALLGGAWDRARGRLVIVAEDGSVAALVTRRSSEGTAGLVVYRADGEKLGAFDLERIMQAEPAPGILSLTRSPTLFDALKNISLVDFEAPVRTVPTLRQTMRREKTMKIRCPRKFTPRHPIWVPRAG